MTSPIETALQTILAADYGLNEGDHLKLCNLLKLSFDASKKFLGKVEKKREDSPLNITIQFMHAGGYKYTFWSQTTIHYMPNGSGPDSWVCPDHLTFVRRSRRVMSDIETDQLIFPMTMDNTLHKIIKLHRELGRIKISRDGIEKIVCYQKFIKDSVRTDMMEAKARKKYGPLPDGIDEHDDACWRGDYGYTRFVYYIKDMLD